MSGIPAGAGSLIGKRLGKYEILALLALGGTAEIYLARIAGAAGFEKYVVVKCLHDHLADDAEFVKMFLDEARLAAHLDHSNIVQTMELGEHENRYYMVMEFLAGLSLAMVVRRAAERVPGGKIPVPLSLNILAQACAGLHYAHEKTANSKPLNIVHRDISPQNLVISFEGVVKVVDFGIAKAELRETRTRSGTIKGKFAYMSPEQCVANNVDRRTDVFALGVIAHELLTGRRLFKKTSPYETYQAVIECAVEPPSKLNHEVDPALDPIILRALAKDKEQRYPTAEAFGDALLGYLHHRGKGSGPGELARFFDASFDEEIEEHGARMRELIGGRDVAGDSMGWGDEDDKRNQTVDLGPRSNETVDLRASTARDAERAGSIGDDRAASEPRSATDTDGEQPPADRTRIEANPLERIQELDNVVAKSGKTPLPALVPTEIAPANPPAGRRATPPAGQPVAGPPSGALPLPAPPAAPATAAPRTPSGRFPELANLPTMIADLEESGPGEPDEAGESGEIDHAETVLQSGGIDLDALGPATPPQPAVDPNARTSMDMRPVQPPPPQPDVPVSSLGYPVVNAQLREQIATGATVFPSGVPRAHADSSRPSAPLPRPIDEREAARPPITPPRFGNPADLASPVGQHYPEQVDWAAAAAMPAKAMPPWKLALLFVGALGGALLLTLVIALIAR
jgi:eukaryotic-like serine/threonine-protein kinase